MNLYETIKTAVTVRQAAEHYGVEVQRSGMCCCPFHDDRHPSMKLNADYFYCFGCGVHGDVIDFVARLFRLSGYQAAQKLACDFGIHPDNPPAGALQRPKSLLTDLFRQKERRCFRVLCDYLHLLEDWKERYASTSPRQAWDERFVEACQRLGYIEHLTDLLAGSELEVRRETVEMLLHDGTIDKLEERLNRLQKEAGCNEEPAVA